MSIADTLARPVGPMPLGAWLVVGGGGLFLAWRSRDDGPEVTREVQQVPVPVGAIAAEDMSPVVHVTPIIRLPEVTAPPPPTDTGTAPAVPPVPTVPAPPAVSPVPTRPVPSVPGGRQRRRRDPLPPKTLTTVLRPGGNVVTTNVNPHPYPTTPPPNGRRVVADGSGREWVTEGSKPGVTGWVWNRNTGRWQAR